MIGQEDTKFCIHCMQPILESDTECPFCGKKITGDCLPHQLVPGTVLNKKFLVGAVIGQGGFGITYIGRDLLLDIRVAIKEYYPNGFVTRNTKVSAEVTDTTRKGNDGSFEKGKENFLKEAKILAKFSGEPGIVSVRDFFEENNTAYIVMEYLEGEDLKAHLKKHGRISPERTLELMLPIMKSLEKIHEQGLIHRDISPDNIRLCENGAKVLDFGAARQMSSAAQNSLSVMLKPGYAPYEQYYSNGEQSGWTDIYALCATMYSCITGITPDEAPARMLKDTVKAPSALGITVNPVWEETLMKGLSVKREDRYETIGELARGFQGERAGTRYEGPTLPNPERPHLENPSEESEHNPLEERLITTEETVPAEPSSEQGNGGTIFRYVIALVVIALLGVAIALGGRGVGKGTGTSGSSNTGEPSPTAVPDLTATPEPTPTLSPTNAPTPTSAPSPTPSPTNTPTPTSTPSPTPSPTNTPTPTVSPANSPAPEVPVTYAAVEEKYAKGLKLYHLEKELAFDNNWWSDSELNLYISNIEEKLTKGWYYLTVYFPMAELKNGVYAIETSIQPGEFWNQDIGREIFSMSLDYIIMDEQMSLKLGNMERVASGYLYTFSAIYQFSEPSDVYNFVIKLHSSMAQNNGPIYFYDLKFEDVNAGFVSIDMKEKESDISFVHLNTKVKQKMEIIPEN